MTFTLDHSPFSNVCLGICGECGARFLAVSPPAVKARLNAHREVVHPAFRAIY